MKPYYDTISRQAHFIREAYSWVNTPFSENAAVKGRLGGVDCVHLAAEVHVACGALPSISLPVLPVEFVRHWHEHHAESRLLSFFNLPEIRGRLKKVPKPEAPLIGDVVVMRYGKTEHHVGLWCGESIVQATTTAGVTVSSRHHPSLKDTVRSLYRFFE